MNFREAPQQKLSHPKMLFDDRKRKLARVPTKFVFLLGLFASHPCDLFVPQRLVLVAVDLPPFRLAF